MEIIMRNELIKKRIAYYLCFCGVNMASDDTDNTGNVQKKKSA